MTRPPPSRRRPPRTDPSSLAAGLLTVGGAVGLDVLSGAGLRHVVALGALAAVVALGRRLSGLRRGLAAALSTALAGQPFLHALGEATHDQDTHLDDAHTWITAAITGGAHLSTAVALVALVAAAEVLVGLVGRAVRRARRLLARPVATPPASISLRVPRHPDPARRKRRWIASTSLRGPPSVRRPPHRHRPSHQEAIRSHAATHRRREHPAGRPPPRPPTRRRRRGPHGVRVR